MKPGKEPIVMAAKKRSLEKTRAQFGAALLDLFRPGWADDIDLGRLDLSDCQACVLGQLFGDYFTGVNTLFAAAEAKNTAAGLAGFENVRTTSWKALIKKRQRKSASA